jgi:alpha-D-ribose 1-methylphosphonate 5-triphosphate synthase subunit PhnH
MAATRAGLAHPVLDSQSVFRAVMHAMARPGTVADIPIMIEVPEPLSAAAAAVCLSLADFETPLWLSQALARSPAADYLRFHTGATVVREASAAAFAVVDLRADPLDLRAFAQGTAEYPDRGATVILICNEISCGARFVASGPGIRSEEEIGFSPAPPDFADQCSRNRAGFPLGVDLVITSGRSLCCLPRSARLAEAA